VRPRRFLVSGLAVATGELVLAAVLSGTVLGPYFLACAALTVALAVGGARLLAPDPPREPPPGRRGPDRGPEPPPWWPDLGDLDPGGDPLEEAHEHVRVTVPG
jgi:hypothetical protein